MIEISKSKTADTRSCDFANVTVDTLRASSAQHIDDVRAALFFFTQMIGHAATTHDLDKLTDIDWLAGMARSGTVRPLTIDTDVLVRAVANTAKLLESRVVVTEESGR